MVRRAKVPRDSNNRILYGRFSHRDLSGWPDGVVHNGRGKKERKRKKRVKHEQPIDVESLPKFKPERLEIGTPL